MNHVILSYSLHVAFFNASIALMYKHIPHTLTFTERRAAVTVALDGGSPSMAHRAQAMSPLRLASSQTMLWTYFLPPR